MSEATDNANGGCMCGAVRYEASGERFSVTHCHCLSCRRHTGAPVSLPSFSDIRLRLVGSISPFRF